MTAALQPLDDMSDAELVAAGQGGDRDAFGRIVARYQSMITGVIYASCGDLHRSEDVAQDAFIAAWQNLPTLRDSAKLPAWLCQIARYQLANESRQATRRAARHAAASQMQPQSAPTADQAALSAEEAELLWRALAEIPQPYRETLVLYYRQGQSCAQVAATLDTSEAAVRKRLERGRSILREQVTKMLEKNLARSAPSAAFAVAIVAALPAVIPTTAKAAVVGVTAKTAAGTSRSASRKVSPRRSRSRSPIRSAQG